MNTTTKGKFLFYDKTVLGAPKVVPLENGADFFAILDEMNDDGSAFYHNRSTIFDACMKGHAFSVMAGNADDLSNNNGEDDHIGGIFCNTGGYYLLPCVCVRNENDEVELIWTHSRIRRKGFAKLMIKELGLVSARNRLPASRDFWKNIEDTVWKR